MRIQGPGCTGQGCLLTFDNGWFESARAQPERRLRSWAIRHDVEVRQRELQQPAAVLRRHDQVSVPFAATDDSAANGYVAGIRYVAVRKNGVITNSLGPGSHVVQVQIGVQPPLRRHDERVRPADPASLCEQVGQPQPGPRLRPCTAEPRRRGARRLPDLLREEPSRPVLWTTCPDVDVEQPAAVDLHPAVGRPARRAGLRRGEDRRRHIDGQGPPRPLRDPVSGEQVDRVSGCVTERAATPQRPTLCDADRHELRRVLRFRLDRSCPSSSTPASMSPGGSRSSLRSVVPARMTRRRRRRVPGRPRGVRPQRSASGRHQRPRLRPRSQQQQGQRLGLLRYDRAPRPRRDRARTSAATSANSARARRGWWSESADGYLTMRDGS